MTTEHELTPQECYERLQSHAGGIGRLAVVTPLGPAIYPLNFTVDAHAIVFRTSAYSELGQLVRDSDVAFEIDAIDWGARRGWSVVLKGRAEAVDDPDEIERLRELGHEPRPWAGGLRRTYIRVPWREITGRVVGEEWLGSSRPAAQTSFGS
jgi:nitroimidazol reductase NimA-like FMN-containing flavoprotein (pyridoxamine 5'-phosphate oxidase superfamily)